MKITIITVCWNSAATIEKTIQSVAAQSYEDIEYIIVDGKSKDATVDIIQRYPDTVTKWVSEPDKGLYDAMNKGIRMATGDYIGIVNADDTFYDESVIGQIADYLSKNPVNAHVGNIVQHREDGTVVRKYSSANWSPEKLAIGFMPPHPSLFLKRSLFERLGYYALDFKIAADYELIIRYFLRHRISWGYSGITTHKMLIGGLSSSGASSYKKVTEEIIKGLNMNDIPFSAWKIKYRIFWKIVGYIRKS